MNDEFNDVKWLTSVGESLQYHLNHAIDHLRKVEELARKARLALVPEPGRAEPTLPTGEWRARPINDTSPVSLS